MILREEQSEPNGVGFATGSFAKPTGTGGAISMTMSGHNAKAQKVRRYNFKSFDGPLTKMYHKDEQKKKD
jgi:hypothetical protein